MYHYHVGAHLAYLGLDALLRALADGKHGDDGSYADDDSQHGQETPELVVSECLQCYFEQIGEIHGLFLLFWK